MISKKDRPSGPPIRPSPGLPRLGVSAPLRLEPRKREQNLEHDTAGEKRLTGQVVLETNNECAPSKHRCGRAERKNANERPPTRRLPRERNLDGSKEEKNGG